jgi:hypothetical protein
VIGAIVTVLLITPDADIDWARPSLGEIDIVERKQ